MESTGNSSVSGDRENSKKTVASSATEKPNGKSTAVSFTNRRNPDAVTALSSANGHQLMFFRDVCLGPREADLRFRLIHFWEARNPNSETLIGQEMLLVDEEVSMLMWTTNSHGLLMILLARPSSSSSSEGGDHSAVMPGEYPVTSKVSDGDNKNDVELPDGMSGELGESTNANHQPFSYVVLGDDLLASTKPVDGPN